MNSSYVKVVPSSNYEWTISEDQSFFFGFLNSLVSRRHWPYVINENAIPGMFLVVRGPVACREKMKCVCVDHNNYRPRPIKAT